MGTFTVMGRTGNNVTPSPSEVNAIFSTNEWEEQKGFQNEQE